MKVLLFTSKPTWIELLFQILLHNKQCYGEVSMSSYLQESQQFSNIPTGIDVYLKCSQQPFDNWVAPGRQNTVY